MITLHWLYGLAGLMFAAFALLSAFDRANTKRLGNATFWGLMALSLLGGDMIGDFGNGLLVLGLAGLAGFGFIGRSHPPTTSEEERQGWSDRLGNKLFLPALIIPATALIGTLAYNYTPLGSFGLIEAKREIGVGDFGRERHRGVAPVPLGCLRSRQRRLDTATAATEHVKLPARVETDREGLDTVAGQSDAGRRSAIAASRKKSAEDVNALIDGAPYNAIQAKSVGLIDDALYREQVDKELKTVLGYKEDEKLRTINGSSYREIPSDSLGLNNGDRVAVIYASGAINVGHSSNGPLSGEMVGSDTLVEAINDATDDKAIKAIVFRVDSPGGSALASDLIWHAIEKAKEKKPVVVSMADVAASGGYYIACNANSIVAEPSTITGSIGVFMGKPVVKGLYDWLGITNEYVMRGKNAGIFRETEKWTPEEREKMVQQTNSIYFDNFVPKVSLGRRKSAEEVNTLGQGRVWTGTQAKERGLVDEFGGLEKAIAVAKQLANLPADKDVKRVVLPEPKPFFESYFGDDSSSESAKAEQTQAALLDALPADIKRSFRYAALLDKMQQGQAMLMMPFELEIK